MKSNYKPINLISAVSIWGSGENKREEGCFKVEPFQRLISNGASVYVGVDREEAEINAANGTGSNINVIPRLSTLWPALKKFDNDKTPSSPSPFSNVANPDYIWNPPITDGQTVSCALASEVFTAKGFDFTRDRISISVYLAAFSDNAMTTKISLFEQLATEVVKLPSQPAGLSDFVLIAGFPNIPATGLTEMIPYNWQNIRYYSTTFVAPLPDFHSERNFKVVFSFELTNYVPIIAGADNPAGLQFIIDMYLSRETSL